MSDKSIQNRMLTVSSSPHILNSDTTKKIMWLVTLALMPATVFGVYSFGCSAMFVVLSSIAGAVISEFFILLMRRKPIKTLTDGSALLTGLIVALNMPPTVPLYIPVISSIFAIAIVKQAFGGLGCNWANPAIAARIFALFAWTKHMTTWAVPFSYGGICNFFSQNKIDTVTSATPLNIVKGAFLQGTVTDATTGPMDILQNIGLENGGTYFDLFFGFKGGSIGEISIFLLLIGAAYLIYKKIITLEIPLSFILSALIFAWVFDGLKYGSGYFTGDVLFQLFTGGLVFGAFFCATDMVTTPITIKGRILFGIGCGLITILVRSFGGLPEGVSLSILFMNLLTPAIDILIKRRPMGGVKIKD